MAPKVLTDLLYQYGPWALCTIFILAIVVLYRRIEALHTAHEAKLAEINAQLFEQMEDRLKVDISYEQAFVNLKEVIKYLIDSPR